MKGKNFVVINGRHYDSVTGVAISDSAVNTHQNIKPNRAFHDIGPAPRQTIVRNPAAASKANSQLSSSATSRASSNTSHAVHKKPQKSQTLHRAAIKRPVVKTPPSETSPAKSPLITKFGPNNSHIKPEPAQKPATASTVQTAVTPAKAPIAKSSTTQNNSRILKEQLIKEKLASVEKQPKGQKSESSLKKFTRRQPKFAGIITMSLAMVMLGGYLTYVNMPNLSVRVASARAGVDAQYPEYQPDGYSLAGPVAYAPGEVTLNFRSNGGPQKYEIKQRASNWDSQAVLDNFVTKESENYLTYSKQGLTVYTYGNKAAWVNGGILYTIEGDASLSSQQILRIAGSM